MLFRFGQRPDSAGEASEAQLHFFFSPHLSLSSYSSTSSPRSSPYCSSYLLQLNPGVASIQPPLPHSPPPPLVPSAGFPLSAMSSQQQQKPLPFGYQFAAGAIAGVSEVRPLNSFPIGL